MNKIEKMPLRADKKGKAGGGGKIAKR